MRTAVGSRQFRDSGARNRVRDKQAGNYPGPIAVFFGAFNGWR